MKKIVFTLAMLVSLQLSQAQIVTPKASPSAEIEQVVGLTKFEINYARPAKKGRSVFGDLVPYGRMWRTGANENTTIDISDDIKINEQTLAKGKYALYTIPSPNRWEVIFYKTVDNWGLPQEFKEELVALKTSVPVQNTPHEVEYFTINVDPSSDNAGNLVLSWEKTMIKIPFIVPTHEKAMESIRTLNAQSKASDYYAAGQYLYTSGEDYELALSYINKAIEMQPDAPYYMLRVKSLVQAKLGDKKGAIETAKISLSKAEVAGNADYVKMNKDSILEWSK